MVPECSEGVDKTPRAACSLTPRDDVISDPECISFPSKQCRSDRWGKGRGRLANAIIADLALASNL